MKTKQVALTQKQISALYELASEHRRLLRETTREDAESDGTDWNELQAEIVALDTLCVALSSNLNSL